MKQIFPWIAASIGGVFTLVLYFSGVASAESQFKIPLLMMLLMSELGFIVTAIGAYFGLKEWQISRRITPILLMVTCAILSAVLAYLGINLWQYITME